MAEERRISPAILIIPVGLGLGLALAVATAAWAAPPKVYTCPVCGNEFGTIEDVQYHFTTTHPREEIPIEWQ